MKLVMPESEKADFRRWVDSLKEENKRDVKQLVTATIMNIERRAKMFVPVDTAFLKGSIHSAFTSDRFGGSVYTGRSYAPYVEFGTGRGVVAPADVRDYAMTFKGRGIRKVNRRAQPYLFPAWRLGTKEMMLKLKQMGFNERSK
jgi:hypothetical protein